MKEKAYKLAVTIFPAYQLLKKKREYDMASQLWRSTTSISANIEEAIAGCSRADFCHRLIIALKEARETRYWLRLLTDIALLEHTDLQLQEIEEIVKILTRTVKTINQNESK